ncbi:heparan sulfate glucosamine 3-O-sulfotransferase 1-like isoform X2 [Dreissena polymorpha]|uniref:Sulfotransferase domain-containing protein n=2 Tax=Dreissena polymorpha TaxID=45954 RepID=A0A9D4CZ40_DREPO|nr:heparan sulfate glucosamine 3-O-sulfotransferase 1-like isoform X2 [Dreissena polymorpha]XP_052239603.1 heparan sulfate glucosamine 3-O-sulfotransferase 1-like isoform X2 [Dreissena polymorpha]KAH3735209.1 hypothetical protein DPMN_041671 [Dreissena polymorpha]
MSVFPVRRNGKSMKICHILTITLITLLSGIVTFVFSGFEATANKRGPVNVPSRREFNINNITTTDSFPYPDSNYLNDNSYHEYVITQDNTFKHGYAEVKACARRFPEAIIIGIQKCGTTALAEFLGIHPQLAVKKEQTYFFSSNYSLGLDWYLHQMPCSHGNAITIERTPQYYYMKHVPGRISEMDRGMKLILIVCDPVQRTVSNFAMAKYRNREHINSRFEEEAFTFKNDHDIRVNENNLYVDKSRYAKYLQQWLDAFPRNQIHVVNGDAFSINPVQELRKIETFLNIDPYIKPFHFERTPVSGFYCLRSKSRRLRCLPRTKGRAHPVVKQEYLSKLKQYFAEQNELFFRLLRIEGFIW